MSFFVAMLVWFMLKDDTNISVGWQSGLLTSSGKKKPAFTAFVRAALASGVP